MSEILYNEDCRDTMRRMKEEGVKVDLTVTSCPYDDLRKYNNSSTWNFDVFKEIARLLYDVTTDGGIVVWVVNDKVEKGSKTLTSFKQAIYFNEIGFNVNDVMIWKKCLSGGVWLYCRNKINGKIIIQSVKDLKRLNIDNYQLWDGSKWNNIISLTKSTDFEKKYQIKLRSGERIATTASHVWPILNKQNEYILKETEKLKIGECLISGKLVEPEEPLVPIYMTEDMAWFIGLYLAEGSRSGQDNKTYRPIQIALNSDEISFVDKIKKAVELVDGGVSYTIDKNKLNVRVYGKVMSTIVDEYIGGKNAKTKHLTNKCWNLPNNLLKKIIEGYLDGDGHYEKINNRWRLGFTRNCYLERDLRTAANRLGATLTLLTTFSKCNNKRFPSFRGEWRWETSSHHNVKNRNEIIDINTNIPSEDFYDITVESNEHLFCLSSGILTHNCNPMPVIKQPRYNPCFEYMIILSKGKPKTFNPLMRPCKSDGLHYTSTVKNMGGENGRRKIDYHVNKETVDYNIWNIAVAKNKETIVIDGKEIRHPAVFPYEIPYRHILSWSNEGDTVLDPFMGSGTTGLACKNTNRNFIGIELNTNYFELAKSKLDIK